MIIQWIPRDVTKFWVEIYSLGKPKRQLEAMIKTTVGFNYIFNTLRNKKIVLNCELQKELSCSKMCLNFLSRQIVYSCMQLRSAFAHKTTYPNPVPIHICNPIPSLCAQEASYRYVAGGSCTFITLLDCDVSVTSSFSAHIPSPHKTLSKPRPSGIPSTRTGRSWLS